MKHLRLMSLGAAALACALGNSAGATVFSSRPLLPSWLRAFDVELEIAVESVAWQGLDLREVALPLSVQGDVLQVRDAHATLAGGQINLSLTHAASATTELAVEAHDVTLGELGPLAAYVRDAPTDAALRLVGRGASVQTIMASADGHFTLANRAPGRIEKALERASQTVFGNLLQAFNPLRSKDRETVLECVAAELDVVGGRVLTQHGLALRTQRMRVVGGGEIDFGAERLTLGFRPEARHGVNLKSLNVVDYVALEGSFAAPTVRIDNGNLLARAATLGASVAIIGGSALANALGRRDGAGTLCAP